MPVARPRRPVDGLHAGRGPGVQRHRRSSPTRAHELTIKKNTVAIVTDGTAVLGLGDIGPAAALPVMEGKALLFKKFAGVDAFPICLDVAATSQERSRSSRPSCASRPVFGGINLEDIAAPQCFEVEERLQGAARHPGVPRRPARHRGRRAGRAARTRSRSSTRRWPTSASSSPASAPPAWPSPRSCMEAGVAQRRSAPTARARSTTGATDLNEAKQWFAENTNPEQRHGLAGRGHARRRRVHRRERPGPDRPPTTCARWRPSRSCSPWPTPIPRSGPRRPTGIAAVIATGRSDFPNQINNVLAFPGIFRGALDAGATTITEGMKLAAAKAIAVGGPRRRAARRLHRAVGVRHARGARSWPTAVAEAAVVDGVVPAPARVTLTAARRPPVEAVTFDFWNTLVRDDRGHRARRGVDAWLGLLDGDGRRARARARSTRPSTQAWDAFHAALEGQPAVYGAHDAVAERARATSASSRRAERARRADRGVRPTRAPSTTRRSTDNVDDRLRRAATTPACASASSATSGLTPSRSLRRYLDGHGLLELFDHWSFSDEVGTLQARPGDLPPRPRRPRRRSTRRGPRTSATCAAPTSPAPRRWASPPCATRASYDDPVDRRRPTRSRATTSLTDHADLPASSTSPDARRDQDPGAPEQAGSAPVRWWSGPASIR